MTINEYQQLCLRTESYGCMQHDFNHLHITTVDERGSGFMALYRLLQGVLGLSGESGECTDLLKKALFQGHTLDKRHFALELGDVAWYLALCADAIGYDLETIFQMNIDKLKARYPDGFDSELSQHRKENDI